MRLTDKCKEDFCKWLLKLKFKEDIYDNLDALSDIEFSNYPESMQFGVYVDFFIESKLWWDVILDLKFLFHDKELDIKEARTKVIEKANQIYNSK